MAGNSNEPQGPNAPSELADSVHASPQADSLPQTPIPPPQDTSEASTEPSDSLVTKVLRRIRWDYILVACIGLFIFPYSQALNNPNERTRVLQARAIVDRAELHIGERLRVNDRRKFIVEDLYGAKHRGLFVNDVALVCYDEEREPPLCAGAIYPAKAPGAAMVGVPALLLADSLGLVAEGPAGEEMATWVMRYGGIGLLMMLALWVLNQLLMRGGVSARMRPRMVIATALGTTILPYGITFVGHALAGAVLLAGAWLVVVASEAQRRRRWALGAAAGLVTSWAVLFEYHAAIACVVIGFWVLLSERTRSLTLSFGAGAAAGAGLHAYLHWHMFNSALKTGHFFLASAHNRQGQSGGFMGIDGLHWEAFEAAMVDPYMGLIPLMPWLAVGFIAGVPRLFRAPLGSLPVGFGRAIAMIPLVYLVFMATLGNYRVMNGWGIGPRYLVPAMLPLGFVACVGWFWLAQRRQVFGRMMAGLAAASVVMVIAVTAVYPSPPPGASNTFGELAVPLLTDGYGVRNVLMSWGSSSLWVLLALGLAAAGWVAFGGFDESAVKEPSPSLPDAAPKSTMSGWLQNRWLLWATAAAMAALWLWGMGTWRPTKPASVLKAQSFAKRSSEGVDPEKTRKFFKAEDEKVRKRR